MTSETLNQVFEKTYEQCNGTIAALKSYSEYAKSYSSKVLKFLEQDSLANNDIAVQIPTDDIGHAVVTYISKSQYDSMVAGDLENVEVVIDGDGNTLEVTADTILNSVENTMAEVQMQSEFIDLCLSNAEHNVSDFITIVKSKYSGISGSMMSKYQDLWDSASPFESLKNLISSRNNQDISNEDGVITIFYKDGYSGGSANLFATALLEVFSDIGSFFQIEWQTLLDIRNFFKKLWDGLLSLLKHIMSKAFGQLFTNYEKGSNKIGILDLPLLQAPLCHVRILKSEQYINTFNVGLSNSTPWFSPYILDYTADDDSNAAVRETSSPFAMIPLLKQNFIGTEDNQGNFSNINQNLRRSNFDNWREFLSAYLDPNVTIATKMLEEIGDVINMNSIIKQLIYVDPETKAIFPRTLDIVVPCSTQEMIIEPQAPHTWTKIPYNPYDVILRFGLIKIQEDDNQIEYGVIIQIFPALTWDSVNNSPDAVTACNLWDTMYALAAFVQTKYWITMKGEPHDHFGDVTNNFVHSNAWDFADHCLSFGFETDEYHPDAIARWIEPDQEPYDLAQYLSLCDPINIDSVTHKMNSNVWADGCSTLYADTAHRYEWASIALIFDGIIRYAGFAGPGLVDINNEPFSSESYQRVYLKSYQGTSIICVVDGNSVLYASQQYPISSDITTSSYQGVYSTYQSSIWHYNTGHGNDWADYNLDYHQVPVNGSESYAALVINNTTFTPYSSYYPYGVSVHYQTYREQIDEVKTVIWAAIIAIIGVTLAVVAHRFKVKRQIKAELAQARLDSMSWDIADNPSKQDIKNFVKARKSAKRISKMNSLLGIGSSEDSTASIIDSVSQLKNQLLSTQGYDEEGGDGATIGRIKTLIDGV